MMAPDDERLYSGGGGGAEEEEEKWVAGEDGDVFNEQESSQITLEQLQSTMSSIKVSPRRGESPL